MDDPKVGFQNFIKEWVANCIFLRFSYKMSSKKYCVVFLTFQKKIVIFTFQSFRKKSHGNNWNLELVAIHSFSEKSIFKVIFLSYQCVKLKINAPFKILLSYWPSELIRLDFQITWIVHYEKNICCKYQKLFIISP